MTQLLVGKTAFVTGAASGIGRATAIAFAQEGAKVCVSDIKGADDVVAEILSAGGEAYARLLDVSDSSSVTAAVGEVVERWGKLDIAFNNAGISLEFSTAWDLETDISVYDQVISVNQRAIYSCMRAELVYMIDQKCGSIINTASVAGMVGLSGPGYCSSKHGVIGLTRSAAIRFASHGIRINAVCPGAVITGITASTASDPAGKAAMEQMSPMGRVADPIEIAHAVVFLASDRASFITGHPLAVDGGYLAR